VSEIIFEWDERKAWSNERKHGVSFDEAQTAFYDECARLSYDPDHSHDEDRYILLGLSSSSRLLVVCHVYQQSDQYIRIISARKATKRESLKYQEFLP
jgi:uncharacterized DUF497 family protein